MGEGKTVRGEAPRVTTSASQCPATSISQQFSFRDLTQICAVSCRNDRAP